MGGMFNTEAEAPEPRSYGRETAATLRAQLKYAPKLFAARSSEEYGDPAETRLGLSTLEQALFGGGGQMGLLDLADRAQPRQQAQELTAQRAQRQADIDAIREMGGASREALRTANPDTTRLLDELNRQANEDLALGTRLNPMELRAAQQDSRSNRTRQGFGQGSENDLLSEALNLLLQGRGQQDRSRAFAGGVAQANQGFYGDPFQQILGRSSGGGALGGLLQQAAGQQRGTSAFNPESAYASDIYNTNYNADAAARIASANNRGALGGAVIGATAQIGSSLLEMLAPK